MDYFASSGTINRRWWLEKGEELADSICENYRHLKDQGLNSPERYTAWLSLYTNRNLSGIEASDYSKELMRIGDEGYRRVKFNLVKLIVDTVVNRIAKMQPRARFLPTAGSASIHTKANLLERFADMAVDQTGLYRIAPKVFTDALIFGLGCLRPYRIGGKFYVERVFPGEVFVDPVEAAYDNVRQLFIRKAIAREVVEYEFVDAQLEAGNKLPQSERKMREAIKTAQKANSSDDWFGQDVASDTIEVIEAWHLPSGPNAKDGKHVISADGVVLFEEAYTRESFPVCFVRWSPEPRGFFGIGLVEEVAGIHVDVNRTLDRIEESLELNASPYVFVEQNSKVKKAHITNVPGSVIQYMGTPPTIQTVNAVPPEYFNYLNNQVDRAFRAARLNMPASGGKLPASLQTGAAWREYHDTDREDFAVVMKEYERFFLDVIKEFVHLGKEAWEEDKSFTVVASKDKYSIERIPWKSVDMDEDAYALRIYPASSLPTSTAGRIDAVMEMFNAGWVSREEAMKMVDMPDLELHSDLANADESEIGRLIELVLDEGIPQTLEPGIDAQLALKRLQAEESRAKRNNVPEERMVLLRMLKQQATEMLLEQQADAMAQLQQAAPTMPVTDGSGVNPLANQGQ